MTKAEPVVKITGIDEHGPLLGWYRHWADFPIGTEFYAASPAGAEVVARVKPLVWRDHKDGRYWIAETAFGEFAIQPYPAGYFATLNDGDIGISGATPDEVKSAVEADHTRRILSALEPTPSTDAVRRQARVCLEFLETANEWFANMSAGMRVANTPEAMHAQCHYVLTQLEAALSTPPAGAAALNEGEEP